MRASYRGLRVNLSYTSIFGLSGGGFVGKIGPSVTGRGLVY